MWSSKEFVTTVLFCEIVKADHAGQFGARGGHVVVDHRGALNEHQLALQEHEARVQVSFENIQILKEMQQIRKARQFDCFILFILFIHVLYFFTNPCWAFWQYNTKHEKLQIFNYQFRQDQFSFWFWFLFKCIGPLLQLLLINSVITFLFCVFNGKLNLAF